MNRRNKPVIDEHQANQLIAEVDERDRQQAHQVIADAVASAENQWIGAPLIVEALAQTLTSVARKNLCATQTAAYLRALATAVESQPDVH